MIHVRQIRENMFLCYAGYIGLSQTDKLNKDMPYFTPKRNGIKIIVFGIKKMKTVFWT